jgi:protease secretion system outer membrane protein
MNALSKRRGALRAAGITLSMLLLLLPVGAAGAMGLMQAYDAALQHDAIYRSALSEHEAGQQYKAIGRAGLLPTLQYNYGTGKNKAQITEPNVLGVPVTSDPNYTSATSSISVHQSLFNLDALARYRQGIAQTDSSDAQLTTRRQDLMIRLVTTYVDAKYAQDQLALYSAQRDAFAEQRKVNDRLFQKGEGSRTDMLETQAKLDVSEAQVIEATDNVTISLNALAVMTGAAVSQLDGLSPEFRLPPFSQTGIEEWEAIAGKNNAELAAARLAEQIAEHEISKSRAGHAPRLDLNLGVSHNRSETLTAYKQNSTVRSIGIQLVVPLYAGGYVNALTTQAVANRDKARADLDATNNKVMIDLRKQISPAQNSAAKMAALEKSVNSATLLVQATRESVRGGVRINLDVLNAQQQLVAAKRDLMQARYNYLISFLKLRMAAGTLETDDLRTVAGYFLALN